MKLKWINGCNSEVKEEIKSHLETNENENSDPKPMGHI